MFPTTYARESSWHPNSRTLELDRPQRDRPAACVIAQQYSYATFVSLRFHFHQEKFGAFFKDVTNLFSYPLKLRKCEIA
jgi:hypothetical protein